MGSDLDIGMKCVKYMLFITNFMFVMVGFLLISIGTSVTFIYNNFSLFMEDHFFSPAALLVAVGILIFFVSVFGCVGAFKGSTCLVNIYALFLFLLLILEISAGIAAYSMRANVCEYIQRALTITIEDYEHNTYVAESWDVLQSRLGCCGVHSYLDWNDITNGTIPDSCFTFNGDMFASGCWEALVFNVSESALLVGTAALCVAIVQILGIVFAVMLAKAIRRIKTEEERKRQESRARLYEQLARGNDEKPTPVIYTANSDA